MADAFDYATLMEARRTFNDLAEADFSRFSEEELSVAAERVRTVGEFLKKINSKLINELSPKIQTVHDKIVQLNERL
ncbi:MAG: hypothetical protein A2293_00315 [Elusimicrobia bacterium RIFOXYB2_FULL_49_7]|nr:MAG: hypothetical protein A2293_00315 [Elusimicrobia bacterium RIFOXYB2_FULL_49_7]